MDEAKKLEIREKIINNWSDGVSKISADLEYEYIFGPLATNQHFLRSDFSKIYYEIQSDMNVIDNYMNGVVEMEPAEFDEEGLLVKDAVHYVPSTEADLLNYVKEDALVLKMNGQTWEEFKNSYEL